MNWFFLLIFGGLVLLVPTAYAGKIGAPYAPTRRKVVRRAFDQLGIDEDDVLVDLGAGDGSIVIEAARHGAKARGWELSPIMWAVAKLRSLFQRRATISFGNFYKKDISDATVVFAFLMPNNMPRAKAYLQKHSFIEGALFLSYMFPLKGEHPISVIHEKNCGPIYVYDLNAICAD